MKAGELVTFDETFCKRVIRTLGFNPEKLGRYGPASAGWSYEGLSNPAGFRRKVVIAYQDLHSRRKIPLTVKGSHGAWGLTEAGVAEVERLREKARTEPNATSVFLNKRLKETKGALLLQMRKGISASLRGVSAAQLDDHVQSCLTRLIARDSLRTRILMDLPILDNHIAQWAINSAYTDARDSASNPVTREFYGARTETERAKGVKLAPLSQGAAMWGEDRKDAGSWTDLLDPNTSSLEDQLQFEQLWTLVSNKIKAKTEHSDMYLNLLKMKMRGYSVHEIAMATNCSKEKATTLLAKARQFAAQGLRGVALQ